MTGSKNSRSRIRTRSGENWSEASILNCPWLNAGVVRFLRMSKAAAMDALLDGPDAVHILRAGKKPRIVRSTDKSDPPRHQIVAISDRGRTLTRSDKG